MPHYDSFNLRLWSDRGRLVHGHVVHVATGQRLAFLSLEQAIRFISEQIAVAEPPEHRAGSADEAGETDEKTSESLERKPN